MTVYSLIFVDVKSYYVVFTQTLHGLFAPHIDHSRGDLQPVHFRPTFPDKTTDFEKHQNVLAFRDFLKILIHEKPRFSRLKILAFGMSMVAQS